MLESRRYLTVPASSATTTSDIQGELCVRTCQAPATGVRDKYEIIVILVTNYEYIIGNADWYSA